MPAIMSIMKATKCKSRLFEHAISILKWPEGSGFILNILHYPIYLPISFPRGLKIDLEGINTFPTFMLLMLHR